MRVAYTDESGVSPKQPILVQAAVIVHGDNQIIPVEERLDEIVNKHIPEEERDRFEYFHATDLYYPKDKKSIFIDTEKWPKERRWAILDDLVRIPSEFSLPITVGVVEKKEFSNRPESVGHKDHEILVASHAMAIIMCEIGVELWMRMFAPGEITHLIAENNNEVQLAAREAHVQLKDPKSLESDGLANHPCFPFVKIRDGLQFATKKESRILQVADVCAWAIRLAASMSADANRFFVPLRSQIFQLDQALTDVWERQLSQTPDQSR